MVFWLKLFDHKPKHMYNSMGLSWFVLQDPIHGFSFNSKDSYLRIPLPYMTGIPWEVARDQTEPNAPALHMTCVRLGKQA